MWRHLLSGHFKLFLSIHSHGYRPPAVFRTLWGLGYGGGHHGPLLPGFCVWQRLCEQPEQ